MKSFFNYFQIVTHMPQRKSVPVAPIISIAVIYCISLFLSGANGWLSMISVFAFGTGITLFCTGFGSPNLEAVFPVSHRKKLLYRFASALFLTLLVTVTVFVLVITTVLIVQIFVPSTLQDAVADIRYGFEATGLYGGLFSLAYLIMLYSSGMIAGFLKRRKTRNIFLAVLCIALFFSDFFMGLPSYYDILNSEHKFAGPFSAVCYEAMSLPWLAIVFWFLVAAGMLGWAIYLGVKHYDPEKF